MVNASLKSSSSYGDWVLGGIDPNLAGNGGAECTAFLSPSRRAAETAFAVAVAFILLAYGWFNAKGLSDTKAKLVEYRSGRLALLALLSLVFGIEIGFKFATKSLIFLLNPCHITTAAQIYLLAAEPSARMAKLFRIQIYFLNGSILAMMFPVTNTRLLPFEPEIYWIQHIGMLAAPYYLLRIGGAYTIEKLTDFSWFAVAYGLNLIYHFIFLQGIGLLTSINLSGMICPNISDPFYGPNYRLAAIAHQAIVIPLIGKLFCVVACYFITLFPLIRVKGNFETSSREKCDHCDKEN